MSTVKKAAVILAAISLLLIISWIAGQDHYLESASNESVWSRYVKFTSGDLSFTGRLMGPADAGNGLLPGVIILHGTSPEGSRLFLYRVLSEELARRNNIVLIYDQRGYGETDDPPRDNQGRVDLDFVGDAVSAVRYLRSMRRIDLQKVTLVGHSFGGSVAVGVAHYKNIENLLSKIVIISPGRGWPYKGDERNAFRQRRLSSDMKLEIQIDIRDIRTLFENLEVETLVDDHGQIPITLVNGAYEEMLKPLKGIYTKMSSPKSIFIINSTGHYFGTNSYFNRIGLPLKIYDRNKLNRLADIILS